MNKARLVAQGYTREERIDYEEVFALVARIEAIRLFLAYASFMGFMVYQMDVKSAFLYGTIEEEVYVYQPLGFEDPDYPDKVYKVVKALYGLHQAPRAWYETLATYLLENDDIIFGATNKDLCRSFEKLMKDKFQMSSIGELTLFLGLQVKQKKDGIFISQDKYVAEILRKFRLTEGKSTSTPIDTEKPLLKDPDGEDVDVHTYRSIISSLMYLTSSRPDIMFAVCTCARFQVIPKASHLHAVKRIFRYLKGKPHLGLLYPKDLPFDLVAYSDSDYVGASLDRKSTTGGCQFLGYRLISWQFKKQTVVATSSTEAEYVAAVSCCAQSNDVTRLQALVDKKKVVITEAIIRDALCLDDAEGVDCLPNEEIFAELARELEEQGDAEEQVQDDVDDTVAQGDDTAVLGDDIQDQSIPSHILPTLPSQQSQDLPSTSQEALDACVILPRCVEHWEYDIVAQALEITKLKRKVKQLERGNKVKVLKLRRLKKVGTSQRIKSSDDTGMEDASNQGRMIDEFDRDEGIALMDDEGAEKKAEEAQVASDDQVKGRQAEIYQIDMDHALKVLKVVTAASESVTATNTTIAAAEPQVPTATITVASSKDKGKGITVEEPKPMKKKQQVEMDEEYARKLHEELNKDIDWDVAIDHVKQKAKEDPYVQRHQIEEEENRAIQSINETPAQKAAKRRKFNEEVEDLKQHLEIVPDEDDDVYTEATSQARKLYVSFITLLKNFDREDFESLWSLVKEIFSTSKPNNLFDDYLLTTLGAMFERPDGQAQVWKSQRSVHGQAKVKSWKLLESCSVHIITFTTTQMILLVERRYPLSRFTLDQMLNAVRLRVEEQSEMSLELLRFTRQQHQEGQLE
nr:putative ribonuclease H-like domain-containing protein [Tanacetum cinerariifolium]